jgi:hypothetical protein
MSRNSPSADTPKTIVEATTSGNRRDVLLALQAVLASAVDNTETPPRDLAALSKRLLEVMDDIDVIDRKLSEDEIGQAADTPDEHFDGTSI